MWPEIVNWFSSEENLNLLEEFKKIDVVPEEEKIGEKGVWKGQGFVLTGGLSSMSRLEAEEEDRKRGGKASGSVSSQTKYLIAGEKAGSKLDKAQKLGIRIINEDEFLKLLEETKQSLNEEGREL